MMEESHGSSEFSFASLRYVVVLTMELHQFERMIDQTKVLLRYSTRPTVSKNQLAEAINDIQDAISKHLSNHPQHAREMYELILGNLKQSNERLWFSTSLRLGKIYLDERNFESLERVIDELKAQCRDASNAYDLSKGNLLLEVFALEIQMCIERKEQRRMKQVFQLTEKFTSVIEDARVVGIIKECGGKMYMTERKWEQALNQFKASFESMVDSGHPRA